MSSLRSRWWPLGGICVSVFTFAAMATITELKSAVRQTLEARGVLGQLKARVRAEVFGALEEDHPGEPRPPLSHENLLINQLVGEYLDFNRYRHAASVLKAESGQPEVPLDRQFLASELKVVEDAGSKSVPLLYGLVSYFLNSSGENGGKLFLRGVAPAAGAHAEDTMAGRDA